MLIKFGLDAAVLNELTTKRAYVALVPKELRINKKFLAAVGFEPTPSK